MSGIIESIEKAQLKEHVDQFNVGDTVRVYAKIREGEKERIQMFEGTVLKRQNGGIRETFTVRKCWCREDLAGTLSSSRENRSCTQG